MGGFFVVGLVIRREGEDFAHAQVNPFFAGADVADALQQFFKVVGSGDGADRRIFQALVVYGKAFLQVFAEGARRPLAELGSSAGTYAVANGDDHWQGVVLDLSPHFAPAFALNL